MTNEHLGEEAKIGEVVLKVIEKGGDRVVEIGIKGEKEEIRLEDLLMFVFPFCDDKRQEQLIPTKLHTSRIFFQKINVEAKKDIRKGEMISFMNKFSMPEEFVTVQNNSKLLIPRGATV
jgi:hypothetical protein